MATQDKPLGQPDEVIQVIVIGDAESPRASAQQEGSATRRPELLHRNRYFQSQRQQHEEGKKPGPSRS